MTSMEIALWAALVVASFANIVLSLNVLLLQRVNARLKDAVKALVAQRLTARREDRDGKGA